MTIPSIVLILICSMLIGAIFHLWRDGGAGRLLFYLTLSLSGFIAGQWIGNSINWFIFQVGSINLGFAATGSLVFLIIGDWLSRVKFRQTNSDDDGV